MARRSHDEYSNSSDAGHRDLTAQFWGSSPSWRTTGTLHRTRQRGERTGPIARTRRHGDPTGQTPVERAAPIDEPHIDPYDFGFDDVGYGPDTAAHTRIDVRDTKRVRPDVDHQPEVRELIELDEDRVGAPGDPITRLVDRLGLGAVDPLLVRLGVIVLIGVLLVPLSMSLRPDSSKGSVRTETTAPSTQVVASGAATVVASAPAVDGVASSVAAGDADESASALPPSDEPVAPAPSPALPATEPAKTAVSEGDTTESAGKSAANSGSPAAEAVQAPQAMAETASEPEAADVAAPAEPVAPACRLTYAVAGGDYWIRVADAAGVTLAKLLQANLATVNTPLYPGDDICLPEGATVPSPPTTTSAPPASAPPTTTTTTPKPTGAPSTTAPPVTSPPTPGEVEDIIREVWPDDLEDKALAIAWRESGYRSNARNWCCHGLFQIHWNAHKSWLDDHGVTSATQLLDARTNTRIAYALYQRSSGWGPWGG